MLLDRSLAPNSFSTYKVGIRQYLAFCRQFALPPFPLSEKILENFCTSLSARVAHKSIKVYLCGVQFWSKLQGGTVLIKNMLRLEYVLMAIRRFQGNSFNRPTRTPITLNMLEEICAFISITESPYDRDMLTSAVLLAFFGLLRVSVFSKQQYYIAALRPELLPTTRAECIVFATANKEFLHGTGDNQK